MLRRASWTSSGDRRAADHHTGVQRLDPGLRLTVDGGEQTLGRYASKALEIHVDAGQIGAGATGEDLPVVEAHDRDVVGDGTTVLAQRVHDAAGHLVAAAED